MRFSARRIAVIAVVGLLVLVASAAATLATVRLRAADPAPTVTVHLPGLLPLSAGAPATIPVPALGSFTLFQPGAGILADTGGSTVRPIGSVAKTMTALAVLSAHPLTANAEGPLLTMTAADVTLYRQAVDAQGSALAVHEGETLSERQLLLALLLPSANNIAETLARWAGGTRAAFITMLNARAAALGMRDTYFDDPSGVSDSTVSTTHDLLLLASAVLANQALAQLVATPTATLPDRTRLVNLDILLGLEPGWLGIKTGWTPAAGGCLLFAAQRLYAGGTAPVTVYGAVLGQPPLTDADRDHPELGGALRAARTAARAALDGNVAVDVSVVPPAVSGVITTPWKSDATVVVKSAASRYVVVRRGTSLALQSSLLQLRAPVRDGAVVGALTGTAANGLEVRWSLLAHGHVDTPPAWWKLFSG